MKPCRSFVHLLLLFTCLAVAHRVIQASEKPSSAPEPIHFEADDWPWWRGPQRNGVARADQNPPLTWSDSKHIVWSAPVPGRGHGSPTLIGDQVVLSTADPERSVQSVLCFDRTTGQQLWETIVHQDGLETKGNEKASQASGTVATDGERFFVNFLNRNAAWLSSLDRNGKILWQQKITDYVVHQGYGSSPAVWEDLVIVAADTKHEAGGAVAAFQRATGQPVWKHARPAKPNYSSPMILDVAGKTQLFLTGCDLVTSLDPLTGKVLWEIEGATTECVTSTVTDGQHIFTSGGYPKNHVSAVVADGSGKVAWEKNARVYVPSILEKDGHLFLVLDAGIAACWNSRTGEELWKGRLGGTFSSSPVLAGDRIYVTNEEGTTYVFRASTEKLEVLAENRLGDSVFATPVFCGNRIFARAASTQDGKRQERLYCIGE